MRAGQTNTICRTVNCSSLNGTTREIYTSQTANTPCKSLDLADANLLTPPWRLRLKYGESRATRDEGASPYYALKKSRMGVENKRALKGVVTFENRKKQ